MSTPSDTPRTDAHLAAQTHTYSTSVNRDFARTLERELNAALARVAELEAAQPPAPTYLDRPDKPGWWWRWNPTAKRWIDHLVTIPFIWPVGDLWTPATPPPPPSKEDVG